MFTDNNPIPYLLFPNLVMIKVTRLDGKEFYINPHQIECIEVRPDTALVMLSGKVHIILDEVDDVLEKIIAYRSRLAPSVVQE